MQGKTCARMRDRQMRRMPTQVQHEKAFAPRLTMLGSLNQSKRARISWSCLMDRRPWMHRAPGSPTVISRFDIAQAWSSSARCRSSRCDLRSPATVHPRLGACQCIRGRRWSLDVVMDMLFIGLDSERLPERAQTDRVCNPSHSGAELEQTLKRRQSGACHGEDKVNSSLYHLLIAKLIAGVERGTSASRGRPFLVCQRFG